tara:strand:+ start:2087 stop:2338 length:252 start_codon:yes stop_codon:yes gene_type:complete
MHIDSYILGVQITSEPNMNIGKSINHAVINQGIKKKELAVKMGISDAQISRLCGSKTCSGAMLDKLSRAFNMQVSELVALGED